MRASKGAMRKANRETEVKKSEAVDMVDLCASECSPSALTTAPGSPQTPVSVKRERRTPSSSVRKHMVKPVSMHTHVNAMQSAIPSGSVRGGV